MTEATIATSQTSADVVAKPNLVSPDGKVQVLIAMHNLWKTYDMGAEKVHALHGVSFEVKRGEYVAITGPSGSGKSTLMNLIGCLDTPSQGEYWLNGKNVSEMDDDEEQRHERKYGERSHVLKPELMHDDVGEPRGTGIFDPDRARTGGRNRIQAPPQQGVSEVIGMPRVPPQSTVEHVAVAELLNAPLLTADGRLVRSHGHHAKIELV